MIKYSPVRETLSASIKEERIFDSIEDMKQSIFEFWSRIFIRKPLSPDDVVVEENGWDDFRIGYKSRRTVYIRKMEIGFCGE